jgi:predicted nucleotidyltransferase
MKRLIDIHLTPNQTQALNELRFRLTSRFKIESLILFGSITRGEADSESDIDLLVITSELFNRRLRHEITDLVFEVNLQYGTNFSTLVVDQSSWQEGLVSVLPIHQEIMNDGVTL